MSKSKKQQKFDTVMKEFSDGKLEDSAGNKVTDKEQALAIAYSESGLNESSYRAKMVRESLEDESMETAKIDILDISEEDLDIINNMIHVGRIVYVDSNPEFMTIKYFSGDDKIEDIIEDNIFIENEMDITTIQK